MRPLKLVMTGFESYCERTEIDFTKLGNNGLFIVYGDTGAGKTTIFDAICFALYGKASGKNRDNEMLRSDFVSEDLITEVEFLFDVNGNKYRVLRRIRNPGDRISEDDHQFEDLQTGEQIKKTTKVTERITDLLGLDKKKFCTVSMIAQGAFQELLLSDQSEKQLLLRDLFDTEKYKRLGDELKSNLFKAKEDREKTKTIINNNISRIEVSVSDENAEEIHAIKNVDFLNEEAINLLKDFVNKDEILIDEIAAKIKEIDKSLTELNISINSASEYEDIASKIEELDKQEKILEEKISESEIEVKNANENAAEIESLTEQKNKLKESLSEYEKIKSEENELLRSTKSIEALSVQNIRLKEQMNEDTDSLNKLKDEQLSLSSAGEKAVKLSSEIANLEEDKKSLCYIKDQIQIYSQKKESLKILQKSYLEAKSLADSKGNEYKNKRDLFNLEQAGILADGLTEGTACPVCGSTSHPQLAVKSAEAPTQNEVEKLEKENEKLSAAANEKFNKTVSANTEISTIKTSLDKDITKYFENLTCDEENAEASVEEEILTVSEQIKTKKQEFDSEQKNKLRKEKLDEQIPQLGSALKILSDNIAKNELIISSSKAANEVTEKSLKEKKSKLKYQTYEEAENAFTEVSKKIIGLETSVKDATSKNTDLKNKLSALNGNKEALNFQLKEKKKGNLEKLLEKKESLNSEKEELNVHKDEVARRSGNNMSCVKEIISYYPEYKKEDEKATMIQELSDLVAGRKGSAASLESYVQMTCLDRINHRANLRLKPMTGNQYELRRRVVEDGKDNILDLNVFDYYTGRERDVKSLSGGEQFQASLSLALGLADEICSSGGLSIDSMFIDEGFGTLDDDTLDKAVKALENLSESNKLVGIISHVNELESRIPKKISVKKDEVGNSHAEIILD